MASTTVTGTLFDIQGVPWINAPIEISFVPNANKPGPVIWTDGPFNPGPILIFTDSNAAFSISLPSTTSIQPSNSTWLFSIGPNASAQAVLLDIGVTGAIMDIGALFTARSKALLIQSLRVPRAYEVFQLDTPVNEGQLWWNTTLGVFQFWNGHAWDTILGTAPPIYPNAIIPNPTGPQAIVQPPDTDFAISTSGGGEFIVNGESQLNGDLNVSGQIIGNESVLGYGSRGIDITASHVKIGTGASSGGALITLVQVPAVVDNHLWLIATNPTQLYFSTTSDAGQDHSWLLVTRNGANATLAEFKPPVQFDAAVNIAGNVLAANYPFLLTTAGNAGVATIVNNAGVITLNIPQYVAAGGGSVTQIVAGANINIAPLGGTGIVTISAINSTIFPPAGIGVSTGSAWAASIDPTTVPRLGANNTFTGNNTFSHDVNITGSLIATGQLVSGAVGGNSARMSVAGVNSVFDAYGPDSATNGAFVFRSFRSDGSNLTNLFSINGAGDALFNNDITIGTGASFTHLDNAGNATFGGTVTLGNGHLRFGDRAGGIQVGPANINADPANIFINAASGGVYFNWDEGTGGIHVGNGAAVEVAHIDVNGNASFNGNVNVGALLTGCGANLGASGGITTLGAGGLQVGWNISNGSGEIDFISTGYQTNTGGFWWYAEPPNTHIAVDATPLMQLDFNGNLTVSGAGLFIGNVFFNAGIQVSNLGATGGITIGNSGYTFTDDGGTSFIDGGHNGRLFFNYHAQGGTCEVYSSFTAHGAKLFAVPHPFIAGKELLHACLEGPENGVYYRGEVETIDGLVQVILPDYFEALTYAEDRSVQLTQIEDGIADFAMLRASRITDGKFSIRSSSARVKVAWEVKAVRRIGVDKLVIVRDMIRGGVNA